MIKWDVSTDLIFPALTLLLYSAWSLDLEAHMTGECFLLAPPGRITLIVLAWELWSGFSSLLWEPGVEVLSHQQVCSSVCSCDRSLVSTIKGGYRNWTFHVSTVREKVWVLCLTLRNVLLTAGCSLDISAPWRATDKSSLNTLPRSSGKQILAHSFSILILWPAKYLNPSKVGHFVIRLKLMQSFFAPFEKKG